jgi:xanthine dehydrogenase accessory factor
MKKILVRRSGDVSSAVAHALFESGYAVFIHDSAQPAATRRKMAFCDAIFDGEAVLIGVQAQLTASVSEISSHLIFHDLIP